MWISYYKKEGVGRAGIQFWPSMTLEFNGLIETSKSVHWACVWRLKWIEYAFMLFLKRGWLACPVPNQWCISVTYRICWFGMDCGPKVHNFGGVGFGTKSSTQFFVAACKELGGWWTTCWLLGLLHLVHLGIHRGFGEHDNVVVFCQVTGSSLRRPWFLL